MMNDNLEHGGLGTGSGPGGAFAHEKTQSATRRMSLTKVVLAASIGNALEWYDLAVYAFLAIPIAKVFFPAHNEVVSLLIALGTFGASYFMRPLGALYLGSYGDRYGRKAAMTLTIVLMGIGTLIIAAAPGYAAAGLAAPLLIVAAKFLQGFSAGGEFGSSVSFLVEHAPGRARGFLASFQIVGVGLANTLASLVGVALNHAFTSAEIVAWAWRIPFILGLVILPFGWFIRKKVDESPSYYAEGRTSETNSPVTTIMKTAKLRIVSAVGLYCLAASTNYLLGVYIPTYAIRELGIPPESAFWGALGFSLVQVFVAPLVGHLSDRYGRRRFIASGIVLVALAVIPAFQIMIAVRSPSALVACVVGLGILVTIFQGPIPAFLSECFPVETRTTGLAVIHNLNFTIFGGFAPLLMTTLISATSDRLVPAYYTLLTAAFAGIGLWSLMTGIKRENSALR